MPEASSEPGFFFFFSPSLPGCPFLPRMGRAGLLGEGEEGSMGGEQVTPGSLRMALLQDREDGGQPGVSLSMRVSSRHRNYSINPLLTEGQHRRAAPVRRRE